jgi:sterol 3beta-glucosyltransferase
LTAVSRITILALGSRGDIQPYVALGKGLRQRGYPVRLSTVASYESVARACGLDFSPITRGDAGAAPGPTNDPSGGSRNVAALLRHLRRQTAAGAVTRFADALRACHDASIILASPLVFLMAYSIAERLQVPLIRAFYSPATPTSAYPAMIVPRSLRLPGRLNRWTHRAMHRLIWLPFRAQLNRARQEALGLGPMPADPMGELDRRRIPVLYGYSPLVCPPPPDWDRSIHVTGYWFLEPGPEWQPPPALATFLESGPPPVYVGFGSMVGPNPAETTRLVMDALTRAGERGILATGWGGLRAMESSGRMYVLDDVPHEWLFPRVAAVVHHAGAGTTGAGLRAGRPTVAVPWGLPDQFFWARRIFELGAGPRPIPRRRLTIERLADAIRSTQDPAIRERAAAIGAELRREDGVQRAADVIAAL